MMATVPHVTSGLGLRKFQADGFLLTRCTKNCTVEVLLYIVNVEYFNNLRLYITAM